MTPHTASLIQASFHRLLPVADEAADTFFDHLFARAPEMRRLFPAAMDGERRRLMVTLAFAVETLEDFDNMLPLMRALGAEYRRRGTRNADFAVYCAAMLHTLETTLGEAWTPAHRDAWAAFFSSLVRAVRSEPAEAAA